MEDALTIVADMELLVDQLRPLSSDSVLETVAVLSSSGNRLAALAP